MAEAIISCTGITRVHGSGAGAVHALRGIDLRIDAGENVAIIGASGSGKSTLLQILGLLDAPTAGSYELAGRQVAGLSDDALSEARGRDIGFVFQSFHLLPRLTLAENVALPLIYRGYSRSHRMDLAHKALEKVAMGHRAHHRPHELSGGERQRGAIARAIVHEPRLILADEPTGNLDSRVKGEILEHLAQLNASLGVTLVVVTHDAPTAEAARRIIRIQDGRIVAEELR